MTVVVVGAGAIGSLFGARIQGAGHAVLLVARPDHAAAVRAHGLRIEGVGAATVRCDAESDLPRGIRAEAVLLTVKTFDLRAAAERLGREVAPVPVLLLQNGLGIERVAVDGLRRGGWPDPDPYVVRAVHSIPATWVAPGVVRAAGTGEVVLPRWPRDDPRDRPVEQFAELLRTSGIPVRTVDDFSREVWRKALVNAAINPVTAYHRVPNGRLVSGPLREEAETLLREALRAATLVGVAITEAEATGDLERVVRATAENHSSMLQDVERGRPTEIDAISGEILRVGERFGVELPATRLAVSRVTALSTARRG